MTNFAVTLMCAILLIEFSIQDKIIVTMDAQHILKMRQEAEVCGKETGVPATALKKVIDWPLENDDASKKFFYCVCFNSGYIQEDGHMIVENMDTMKAKNGTQEEFLNRIRECNKITLENNLETLYALGGCFHDQVIVAITN